MDNSWRASLAHDSRQKIVKRIMDTLQRHMPVAGQDGVDELLKIAWRFEEKIFQAATDQQDYLRKISLKMLSLETKANGNPLPSRHPPGAQVAAPGVMKQVEHGGISKPAARRKVIIDTDPGIDDMMAIFMAFQNPGIEVIGLTTIFGNVDTELATINALHLCEVAGFPDIPVAEGPPESLQRVKPRIAYFVHGSDGFGETHQANPKGQKSPISAADFLVEKAAEFPGEVTVVALGPLTNIALAIQKDPGFAKNVGQLVVLGGAFNACGNVNPAAEANIFGDPVAADIVFTAGLNTVAIGINLTTQVVFSEQDLCEIRDSGGKYGQYVYDCCRFYHTWHMESDRFDGIYLHDPTCMAALLDPSLFTFRKGAVRVETEGLCAGHTLLDYGLKNWVGNNPWIGVPPVDVGITVDANGVRNLVKKLLCSS